MILLTLIPAVSLSGKSLSVQITGRHRYKDESHCRLFALCRKRGISEYRNKVWDTHFEKKDTILKGEASWLQKLILVNCQIQLTL